MKVDSEILKSEACPLIEHALVRLGALSGAVEARDSAVLLMLVTGWVLSHLDEFPKRWRIGADRPTRYLGLTLEEVRRVTDLVRLRLDTGSKTS